MVGEGPIGGGKLVAKIGGEGVSKRLVPASPSRTTVFEARRRMRER
jgi:hypothetical protein